MTCLRFRELLSLSAGRDLDPGTASEVGRHLASCPACRRSYEAYGAQRQLLRRYGQVLEAGPEGPGLWPRLRSRLS